MALQSAKKISSNQDQSSAWLLVRRLVQSYLKPHLPRIGAAFACMAVVAITTAGFTQLMKPIINEIFLGKREDMLVPVAAVALAVFTTKGLASLGQAVLMAYIGHKIVAQLQAELYGKLIHFDLAFFHRQSPGELVSRFISDITRLRTAIADSLTGIGKDSLTGMALIAVMFYEDWALACIAFFAFPLALLPIVKIARRLRKTSRTTQAAMGIMTTRLDESFQGIRQVKAYGMEQHEKTKTGQAIESVFKLNFKMAWTRGLTHPLMEFLGGLAVVGVILYGGHLVINEGKDPGSFFAFVTALLLAYEPLKRLARLNANLAEGLGAADRVFMLLDDEPAVRQASNAKSLEIRGGEVRLEGVTFAYDNANMAALRNATITADAGSTVALVGPSGAGKSTILNLIPRFYDLEAGRILIDGQDLTEVTFDSLRESIALVSQEILLFDDSVGANIAYGRPGASHDEVVTAAKLADAHDFIQELPEGYDTQVGPRGENLSGGQRQRLAIARALLKDAPILLLDEATSALDSETERQVQSALNKLIKGRTTIVIAHRLSTVRAADRIYVLDQGEVVDSGRHDELLGRGGLYERLHKAQFHDDPKAVDEESEGSLRSLQGA